MPTIHKIKHAYNKAKQANKGETCSCPSCGTLFTKKTKQQVFCHTDGNKCHDFFWNAITEGKAKKQFNSTPKELNLQPNYDFYKN